MRGFATLGALALLVLSACTSGAEPAPKPVSGTIESPAATTSATTPAAEATYVRAPGDPKRATLAVTIVDEAGWMYDPATGCGDGSDVGRGFVALSGPTRTYAWAPLGDEVWLPESGTATPEGHCTVSATMTVPFAPRYDIGVGFEGKGIADGTEPHQFVRIGGRDHRGTVFTPDRDADVQQVDLVIVAR